MGGHRHASVILLMSVLIRLPWLADPILNMHDVRQTQTAMQARNLLRDHFDLFHTRIDWLGTSPGYMALEFPVFQGLVALLYKAFGIHEFLGKAVSLAAFVLAAALLYAISRRLVSRSVAVWATAWFAFSPLVFSASLAFIPDMLTLALGLCALCLLLVASQTASNRQLAAAIAVTLAAFLSKSVMCLPLFVPIGYLLYRRFGRGFLLNPWSIAYGALVVLPLATWTAYTERLDAPYNLGEHIPSKALAYAVGTLHDRFALETYSRLGQYYGFWILGVVGLPLCVFGAIVFIRELNRKSALLLWWAIGVMGYYAFYTVTIVHHSYYQLPAMPLVSVFVGIALDAMCRRMLSWPKAWRVAVWSGLAILYLGWWWIPVAHSVQQDWIAMDAATSVQAHTDSEDLVLVAAMHKEYAAPADYRSYPSILYYADRRGWDLGKSTLDDASILALRAKGAKYLVLTWGGERNWLSRHIPRLYDLQRVYAGPTDELRLSLTQAFETVDADDHHLLFRLDKRPRPSSQN